MSKKNFVSLLLGTVGGILFALGMCMAMIPEWNAFQRGRVYRRCRAGSDVDDPPENGGQARIGQTQRQSHRHCGAGRHRCFGAGHRHVHGHGMEHDGTRHSGWLGRHPPAALPDPTGQGHPVGAEMGTGGMQPGLLVQGARDRL